MGCILHDVRGFIEDHIVGPSLPLLRELFESKHRISSRINEINHRLRFGHRPWLFKKNIKTIYAVTYSTRETATIASIKSADDRYQKQQEMSFSLFAISYGTIETAIITSIISADDRCRKQRDTSASPVGCKLFCPFSPAS